MPYVWCFFLTVIKGCVGIVFTHDIWLDSRAVGKILYGMYLRNRQVYRFDLGPWHSEPRQQHWLGM